MGRKTITCFMDLPDYTLQVHRRNPLFHDLCGRGYYPSGNGIPHTEIKFLHTKRQRWIVGEELRFGWRTKRKCYGPISQLSTQALAGIRCQRKTETTSNRGLGFKKSFTNYKEPSIRKVGTQLGRAVSYHISGRNRCVLSWRSRGKCCTTSLKCK